MATEIEIFKDGGDVDAMNDNYCDAAANEETDPWAIADLVDDTEKWSGTISYYVIPVVLLLWLNR